MQVIKRDGKIMDFDPERIRKSINIARSAVYYDDLFLVDTVLHNVCDICYDKITTTEIRHKVESELCKYGASQVYEAYSQFLKQTH